jgi:hypothetical protein
VQTQELVGKRLLAGETPAHRWVEVTGRKDGSAVSGLAMYACRHIQVTGSRLQCTAMCQGTGMQRPSLFLRTLCYTLVPKHCT